MELITVATDVLDEMGNYACGDDGNEVAPGFFSVYNSKTGQSRPVVYHPESGFCFKRDDEQAGANASGKILGTVEWFSKILTIRLPEQYSNGDVVAQEFVIGESCECLGNFCEHTAEVSEVTGYRDTHKGNWLIRDDEIILFDFTH